MLPEGLVQFLSIFFGFAVGTIYAGKAMRKCIELGLYNEVNERSSHKTPTPRGGGYAFVVITSLFSLIWLYFADSLEHQTYITTLTLSGMCIAYLGWLDDRYNISAKLRFSCQLMAVGLCVYTFPTVLGEFMPLYAEKIIITLAWVWFINLYNFMDGIDGIAAVQAAFMALLMSMFMPSIAPILLVLAGSVLGILRFNWHPARVFMGDVGSTYLGFILAGFMFYSLSLNLVAGFWTSLIISSIFILDATFTLTKRLLSGKAPWQAHKEHFYQRATSMGMSHSQVVVRVILMNILFGLSAIFAFAAPYIGIYAFAFTVFVCTIVAIRIKYLEGGLKKS